MSEEDIFWHEYQTKARSTAIYPDQSENPLYPTLGLIGEIGEIANKVKKIMRDDEDKITEKRCQEIGDEIGDTLWYIANLCYELSINMHIFKFDPLTHVENSNIYYEITKFLPPLTKIGNTITSLTFGGINTKSQKILIGNIGLILQRLHCLAMLLNLDIKEIANQNIQKLFDRKDRGVIGGSGDGR